MLYRINSRLRLFDKPVRSEPYLRFLREFPCVACGGRKRIEAAHTGPHGIGTKASDAEALPLCRECHREGKRALHRVGPGRFQVERSVDFTKLTTMFQHFWFLRTGKRIVEEPARKRRAA